MSPKLRIINKMLNDSAEIFPFYIKNMGLDTEDNKFGLGHERKIIKKRLEMLLNIFGREKLIELSLNELQNKNYEVRLGAIALLDDIDAKDITNRLINSLFDDFSTVSIIAAKIIGNYGDEKYTELLIKVIDNFKYSSLPNVKEAIISLGKIGNYKAILKLYEIVSVDGDNVDNTLKVYIYEKCKTFAIESIKSITARDKKALEIYSKLLNNNIDNEITNLKLKLKLREKYNLTFELK